MRRAPILVVCLSGTSNGEALELQVGVLDRHLLLTLRPNDQITELLIAPYDAGRILELIHFRGSPHRLTGFLRFEGRPSLVAADIRVSWIENTAVMMQVHAIAETFKLALLMNENGAREYVRRVRSLARLWPKSTCAALDETIRRIFSNLRV